MSGDPEPLSSAESADPLRYVETIAESEDPAAVVSALVDVANAGAALTLAIYHGGKDFVLSMPDPVAHAYMRACRAYQVGRGH